MNSNFDFLNEKWPDLAQIGRQAEMYLFPDPYSSMSKSGLFAEVIVEHVFDLEGMEIPITDSQFDLISRLFAMSPEANKVKEA